MENNNTVAWNNSTPTSQPPTSQPNFTIGNTPSGEEVHQDIFADNLNTFKQESQLLDTSQIEPGEHFSGIVYTINSVCNRSKYEEDKYNIKFRCIDKQGKVFQATLFNYPDRVDIARQSMKINKGIAKQTLDDQIYLNLQSVDFFQNENLPVSIFLKEIPNLADKYDQIINHLQSQPVPAYTNIVKFLEQSNTLITLKTNTLSATTGTHIGSPLDLLTLLYGHIHQLNRQYISHHNHNNPNQPTPFTHLYMSALCKTLYVSLTQGLNQITPNQAMKEITKALQLAYPDLDEEYFQILQSITTPPATSTAHHYQNSQQLLQELYSLSLKSLAYLESL